MKPLYVGGSQPIRDWFGGCMKAGASYVPNAVVVKVKIIIFIFSEKCGTKTERNVNNLVLKPKNRILTTLIGL